MHLQSDVFNPMNVDPLLALMLAECETVEDEYEAESLYEQHVTKMLAAQHKTSIHQSQE